MKIGGVSIVLILGIINIVLILFQISTGQRWIRIPFPIHKRTGIALFFCATLHALLAFLANYG